MVLLTAGLLLFTVAHLFPSVQPGARDKLVDKLGFNPYRGLFSLVVIGALVVTVFGWKSATPSAVYVPPFRGGPITAAVVFVAFVLFVASQTKTTIRAYVRHPQMMAVILWSLVHLLVNGDSRSVALFGGLGVWALLEMFFCNRRDGEWQKPAPASRMTDVLTVTIGAIAFAVIWYFHQALFGVPPY